MSITIDNLLYLLRHNENDSVNNIAIHEKDLPLQIICTKQDFKKWGILIGNEENEVLDEEKLWRSPVDEQLFALFKDLISKQNLKELWKENYQENYKKLETILTLLQSLNKNLENELQHWQKMSDAVFKIEHTNFPVACSIFCGLSTIFCILLLKKHKPHYFS